MYPLIITLLITIISSTFFVFLYNHDNKYTSLNKQPINGYLKLSTDDINNNTVNYLIYDWEYYPGSLLNPKDFNNYQPHYYREYVSIGEFGGLEMDNHNRDSHGSGTYRLTVTLPSPSQSYTIELPEIFSAYNFYVNDDLYLKLGNPDPNSYEDAVQNRIVTFYGEGTFTFTLAVTDYSHIYSGMISPPVLGSTIAVNTKRGIHILIHGCILLFSLFCAIISFSFGLKLSYKQGYLFCLISLCLAGCSGYVVLHHYATTRVQPWYAIEMLCYCGMILFSIKLQNKMCISKNITAEKSSKSFFDNKLIQTIPIIISAVFTTIIFIFYLYAGKLEYNTFYAASIIMKIYQWSASIYLLATAVIALTENLQNTTFLIIGSCFLAISLVAEHAFPIYEPIFGAYFYEIGGAVVVLSLGTILWLDMSTAYRLQLSFAEEKRQMQRQMWLQAQHYRQLSKRVEEARHAKHDLRQHMRTIKSLAHNGSYEEIDTYISNYEPSLARNEILCFSSHYAIDALISYYKEFADNKQIDFNITIKLPSDINFADDELCIIIGNLIENSIEACSRQKNGPKIIDFRCVAAQDQLSILVLNTFSGKIRKHGEHFYSSKTNTLGIGTESVKTLVAQHNGMHDFTIEGEYFKVALLIPLTQ